MSETIDTTIQYLPIDHLDDGSLYVCHVPGKDEPIVLRWDRGMKMFKEGKALYRYLPHAAPREKAAGPIVSYYYSEIKKNEH